MLLSIQDLKVAFRMGKVDGVMQRFEAVKGVSFDVPENGTVALVEATPAGYKERGRFSQPERGKRPAWPYPVVANGCLYLRDLGVLLCYDVRDPNAGN